MEERAAADSQFKGLLSRMISVSDLTPKLYDSFRANPNSLYNWLPAVEKALEASKTTFKSPKTKTWRLPIKLAQFIRMKYSDTFKHDRDLYNQLVFDQYDLEDGKTYFIKTGFDNKNKSLSGSFYFIDFSRTILMNYLKIIVDSYLKVMYILGKGDDNVTDKELLIKALKLSDSNNLEGFFKELLEVYLDSKNVEMLIRNDSQKDVERTKQVYVMQWADFMVTGYSLDGVNIVIESGSYFSPEENKGLANSYRVRRKQLIDQGIVQNNHFIEDVSFSSLSAAASICRGNQMNGRKAFKLKEVEALSKGWLEVIKEALGKLGGQGSLSEIYKEVEALYPEKGVGSFKDTIRGTIYRHASQSEYYQGGEDAFKSLEIGSGIWELR